MQVQIHLSTSQSSNYSLWKGKTARQLCRVSLGFVGWRGACSSSKCIPEREIMLYLTYISESGSLVVIALVNSQLSFFPKELRIPLHDINWSFKLPATVPIFNNLSALQTEAV